MSHNSLYQYDLMDHAKNPRNYGLKIPSDFCSQRLNPSCGDMVQVCGFIKNDRLTELYFEGSGCVLSLAMASKLTQHVVGMSLEQVMGLDERAVYQLLGLELGINRIQCGLLAMQALQQGIMQYKNDHPSGSKNL